MEYVRLALLVIQLLNAMKEKEKGESLNVNDISDAVATAEAIGVIKSKDADEIREGVPLISDLLEGLGKLLGKDSD